LGPEARYYFGGIDAGPVLKINEGTNELGARDRLFISIATATLYVGEWYQPKTTSIWSTEIGVLFKIPTLHKGYRGWTFAI
jgi:hypothetical protein